ncbi:hypothetical protein, partial [Escherichia marmotae]|uniref:hypothetical protein n=2 Tax=Escherichia TaxID=561 RepID=UPI0027E0AE7D
MPDALTLIRPTNLCLNGRPDKAFTPHPAICTDAGCAYAYPTYKSCFNGRPDKAFTPHPAICTDAGCAYAYPAYKFVP